jgi:hypothetical protein
MTPMGAGSPSGSIADTRADELIDAAARSTEVWLESGGLSGSEGGLRASRRVGNAATADGTACHPALPSCVA